MKFGCNHDAGRSQILTHARARARLRAAHCGELTTTRMSDGGPPTGVCLQADRCGDLTATA